MWLLDEVEETLYEWETWYCSTKASGWTYNIQYAKRFVPRFFYYFYEETSLWSILRSFLNSYVHYILQKRNISYTIEPSHPPKKKKRKELFTFLIVFFFFFKDEWCKLLNANKHLEVELMKIIRYHLIIWCKQI